MKVIQMSSLKEKYAVKLTDYYAGVRKDILPLVPSHSRRVLEIGCGKGNTLAYLKDNSYCDWTCGVELFPEAVESAKEKLDEVHHGNIEEMILPIEPGTIDMILCLDVLEHLINPQKVVAYLHTLLSEDGMIIASIPNIRHYSASFPLLILNKWEYKDYGILDNTHLRFFVRSTAIDLMQSSGLVLDKIMPTGLGRKGFLLNKVSFKIFESFLSLQYLVAVKLK
jgi:2-polyprenyl-3-methyl-5-hydroxy-6-metoxy-1,4-benzoquinol methylase